MNRAKIKIVQYVDRNEFISALMGSSWEIWQWWHSIDYVKGSDWDRPTETDTEPYVRVEAEDLQNDMLTIRRTLSVADLVTAFTTLQNSGDYHFTRWDDFDAAGGDAILQQAVYGEVWWS